MTLSTTYYQRAIDVSDSQALEAEIQALLNTSIHSAKDLEEWLVAELHLGERIEEVLAGHTIDFYRDTTNSEKRELHMHDQTHVQPLLLKYLAEFDRKVCESPYLHELNDDKYGLMKRVRATNLELFREENVPLRVREQEIIAQYNEIIGGIVIDWNDEEKSLPFVQAMLDSPDRGVREQAFRGIHHAYRNIKSSVDEMMNELVSLRHQIAVNAGFKNYLEYSFREKNREYSIEDCRQFHEAVENFVVPVWDHVANDLKHILGVDTYRPWDQSNCTLSNPPFTEVEELISGVERILRQTDEEFADIFVKMNERGLLDLEGRQGKAPGGFCSTLVLSRTSFVFANFSPSFFALIALIHEMGHAINAEYQLRKPSEWGLLRPEIAELYSHGMELVCLEKLGEFYRDEKEKTAAIRERIRRSLAMLMGPVSGDRFQHWMYENPSHTVAERDAAYFDIMKRYSAHPVNWTDHEEELANSWIASIHFIGYPFYNIEYSMAELGALKLMEQYKTDPKRAIANYKRGASTDYNQSIAQVYEETGVSFDFSNETIERTAKFLAEFWTSIR